MHNYCSDCGTKTVERIPEYDDTERKVCPNCGKIFYNNPEVLVIGLLSCGMRMLWLKRAHPPQVGKWLIPMGYVESHETLQMAVAREIHEEVGLEVPHQKMQLIALGMLVRMNQLHIGFHAELAEHSGVAGAEVQELDWFTEEEAPWSELAYVDAEPLMRRIYAWLQSGKPTSGVGSLPPIKEFIVDGADPNVGKH